MRVLIWLRCFFYGHRFTKTPILRNGPVIHGLFHCRHCAVVRFGCYAEAEPGPVDAEAQMREAFCLPEKTV